MKKFNKAITPEDILAVCGGKYYGEQNITLQSIADPEEADSSSVIFWEQGKYLCVKTHIFKYIFQRQEFLKQN